MSLAPVQFDEDLVAGVQVKDHAVAGVVVALVLVLGDGAGPHLERNRVSTESPSSANAGDRDYRLWILDRPS